MFSPFSHYSAIYHDCNPDVAYTPTLDGGKYLLVWQRNYGSVNGSPSSTILIASYDRDGNPIGALGPLWTTIHFANRREYWSYKRPAVAFGGPDAPQPNSWMITFEMAVTTDINSVVKSGIGATIIQETGGILMPDLPPIDLQPAWWVTQHTDGVRDRRPDVAPSLGAWVIAWDRTSPGEGTPDRIMIQDVRPDISLGHTPGTAQTLQSTNNGYLTDVQLPQGITHTVSGHSMHRAVWTRFWETPLPGDTDIITCSFTVRRAPYEFSMQQLPTRVSGAMAIGINEA